MEITYSVLWHQDNSMYPVFRIEKNNAVSFTTNISEAGIFTEKEAQVICDLIRKSYGEQYLQVVQNPPASGEWTQERFDNFLPHWSWLKKYR